MISLLLLMMLNLELQIRFNTIFVDKINKKFFIVDTIFLDVIFIVDNIKHKSTFFTIILTIVFFIFVNTIGTAKF